MPSPSPNKPDPPASPELPAALGFHLDDETWVRQLRGLMAPTAATKLGDYEFIEEVGRGGQGVVYKARQPGTDRIIAIKRVTAAAHGSSSFRTRFEREVRAASALNHPNIVTVYGCEMFDGQPLLLMEYIEGLPVDRWASPENRPMREPREVLGLFQRITAAISHAHQHGIIHRDLKPSNVLVDQAGEPHVLDFGLARILSPLSPDSVFATQTTGFVGTPAFASPEHFSTVADSVDVRSDVYSVGAMLYQALTGKPPFADQHRFMDLARAVELTDPQKPSQLRTGLNREIEAIVLKAMAKTKTERYQSMDAFAEDIHRYLIGQPVLAHPPGTVYQLRKMLRRHKLAFGSAIGFIVLIAAFAVTATALAVRERAARKDADWNTYVASVAAASAALRANDAGSAQQQLERAPTRLREWEWRYFSREADESMASTWIEAPGIAIDDSGDLIATIADTWQSPRKDLEEKIPATSLTRDHNRRYAVSAGLRWVLNGWFGQVIHRQSGVEIGRWPFPENYSAHFSPDERTLALADQYGELKLISLPQGAPPRDAGGQPVVRTLTPFPVAIEGLAFRADSQQLAASAGDGNIAIVDVPSAQVVDTIPSKGSAVWAVAFSPDGNELATGSWDKSVTLWDLSTKRPLWTSTGHRELISALAFSANGDRLASGSWDKTIGVWDTSNGELMTQLVGHTHEVGTLAFLGGNERIASYDAQGVLKLWAVTTSNASLAGGAFRRIEAVAGTVGSIASGWIAVAEGHDASWRRPTVSLIDYRGRVKSCELWTHESPSLHHDPLIYALAVSPDGQWLAAGVGDGTVLLWRGGELGVVVASKPGAVAPPAPAVRLEFNDPDRCRVPPGARVDGPGCWPLELSFAADSHRLVVSRFDGGVEVWDIESRTKLLDRPPSAPVRASGGLFIGNGDRLAVVRAHTLLELVDVSNEHTLLELPLAQGGVFPFSVRLAGSPDGTRLALAEKNDVVLYDTRGLAVVHRLVGHQRTVTAVSFSPDGRRLVSASYDNTLKLWDVAIGREVATLHGHEFRATCVAFLDADTIVSGGHDNQIRFWEAK